MKNSDAEYKSMIERFGKFMDMARRKPRLSKLRYKSKISLGEIFKVVNKTNTVKKKKWKPKQHVIDGYKQLFGSKEMMNFKSKVVDLSSNSKLNSVNWINSFLSIVDKAMLNKLTINEVFHYSYFLNENKEICLLLSNLVFIATKSLLSTQFIKRIDIDDSIENSSTVTVVLKDNITHTDTIQTDNPLNLNFKKNIITLRLIFQDCTTFYHIKESIEKKLKNDKK